jgi:hypothetical protein
MAKESVCVMRSSVKFSEKDGLNTQIWKEGYNFSSLFWTTPFVASLLYLRWIFTPPPHPFFLSYYKKGVLPITAAMGNESSNPRQQPPSNSGNQRYYFLPSLDLPVILLFAYSPPRFSTPLSQFHFPIP